MPAIVLDAHRGLFRDEAAFDTFVALMKDAAGDLTPVWGKQQHLATLLSPANAMALIQQRMIQRLADKPALLDEVRDRLENDAIVV